MGGGVLIICFVVVVIGGIGSITGALIASLLVGFVDTFGKVFFAEYSGIGVGPADGGVVAGLAPGGPALMAWAIRARPAPGQRVAAAVLRIALGRRTARGPWSSTDIAALPGGADALGGTRRTWCSKIAVLALAIFA